MRFHFYHADTGVLHGNTYSTSISDAARAVESASMNAPPGYLPIKGIFDHLSQRIDVETGEAVDYQPTSPGPNHEWDTDSKRWMLNAEFASREKRKVTTRLRIAYLEANVQPRAIREAQLNRPGSMKRLQDIDDEIEALRKALTE